MIYLAFIALAAIFNAIMDVLDHSFSLSIFKKLPQRFWKKDVSWMYAKQFIGYKFDAWHIAKSIMVILIAFAVVTFGKCSPGGQWWHHMIYMGLAWNVTFEIAYKLFKTK